MPELLPIIVFFIALSRSYCDPFAGNSYILDIDGEAQSGYHITVGVGVPPQTIRLLIDTGSSNMAILVSSKQNYSYFDYELSETFQTQDQTLSIRYTEGSWSGFLAVDKVSLGSIPICTAQMQFSCITSSKNIFEESSAWEGILGMAYSSIAKPDNLVKPFFDTLINSCNLNNVFSVSLCGPFLHQVEQLAQDGKLILGNISDKFYSGSILYTPILKEWYYEIMVTGLKVGDMELDLPCSELNNDKSIVDTGTTFLAFPSKIYDWIVEQMKNHTKSFIQNFPTDFWTDQAIACVTDPDFIKLFPTIEILFFYSKNSSFSLRISPDMYLLRYYPKYHMDELCFKLTIGPSDKGTIIGATVLKGFYVIFDRENKRMGFANSTCVESLSDSISTVINPKYTNKSLDCKFQRKTYFVLQIVMYIMISLILVCVAPLLFTFIPCLNRFRKRWKSNDQSNLVKVVYDS